MSFWRSWIRLQMICSCQVEAYLLGFGFSGFTSNCPSLPLRLHLRAPNIFFFRQSSLSLLGNLEWHICESRWPRCGSFALYQYGLLRPKSRMRDKEKWGNPADPIGRSLCPIIDQNARGIDIDRVIGPTHFHQLSIYRTPVWGTFKKVPA